MGKYRYVIQRRYQTELAKKVGGALDKMFQHIDGNSLHILEDISLIEAGKPLTKRDKGRISAHLLQKAKEEGYDGTLGFEVVPYEESIQAKAERKIQDKLKVTTN